MIERYCNRCNESTADGTKSKKAGYCQKCKMNLIFRCLECKKGYRNRDSIVHHMGSGCGIGNDFCCSICDFIAASKIVINDHFNHVHSDGIDPTNCRSCTKCGTTLKDVISLRKHLEICGKEPNFFCDICPFVAECKSKIIRHLRIHASRYQKTKKSLNTAENEGTNIALSRFFHSIILYTFISYIPISINYGSY